MTQFLKNYSDIRETLMNHKIFIKKFEASTNMNSINLNISNDLEIEPDCIFYGQMDCLVTMGAFSYSNSPLHNGMKIGRYCSIGANLQIMGATHFSNWISTSPLFYKKTHYDSNSIRENISHAARSVIDVEIGNDVWIGSNVTIKKHCRIGSGSILAANSVITKEVPPFSIVGGNPAKLIRHRFNPKIISLIYRTNWWDYHLNDLSNLTANDPEIFLEKLEALIQEKRITPYTPKKLTKENF